MASVRQVRNWILECVQRALRPDALAVEPEGDDGFVVITRQAGTLDTPGDRFRVRVSREEGKR